MGENNPSFISVRFFVGGFLITVLVLYAFIKWADPLGISRSNPANNPALSLDEHISTELESELLAVATPSPTPTANGLVANTKERKTGKVEYPLPIAANNRTEGQQRLQEAHFDAISAKWFSTEPTSLVRTGFGSELKYPPPPPVETKVDPACPKGVKSKLKSEFSQSVKDLLGISGDSRFPKDTPIDRFTLFWKKKKEHFQVNATWQMNDPPTYVLEKWKANDAKMLENAEQVSLGSDQTPEVVWSHAESFLEKELKGAIEDGAEEGARIFTATIGEHQATFLNSIPIQLSGQNFQCEVTDTGETSGRGLANCECP